MPKFGTEQGGFTVEQSPLGVRVRAWGFWDNEVATAFPTAVLDVCRAGRVPLILDARELKPQREEGQAAFRKLAGDTRNALARVQVVVTNAITKLQLTRIVKECGAQGWSFEAPSDLPGT